MKSLLLNAGLVLLLASGAVGATAIQVTTRNDQFGEDTTKCSLREAVQAANTDAAFGGCPAGSTTDIITFDGFSNHPVLSRAGRDEDANATGDLDVSASGTILFVGNSTGGTEIDGDGIDRVFDLDCRSDLNVQFNTVTIRGGDAGSGAGGGIYMCAHSASLYAVHMTENSANLGGALYIPTTPIAGAVTVNRSAFTRNRSTGSGGGAIAHYGSALLKLTNTTLSENVAQQSAALYVDGDVTMKNVTVAYNTGSGTGGVYIAGGVARFDNSLFSDNASSTTTATATDLRCVPVAFSDGYNIWNKGNCTFSTPRASDLPSTDPRLGTLADAGRAVPVHVLLPGSPAQNTGAPAPNDGSTGHCESTDQRGIQRQQCDRGAFEGRVNYDVNSTADAPDSNPGNGVCLSTIGGCTLRAALMEAGAQDTPILISIPAGVFNVNIPGADEELGVTGDLDITALEGEGRVLIGQGPDKTIIRGTGVDRVFDLSGSSANRSAIGLFGMRVEGGNTIVPGPVSTGYAGGGARFRDPRALTIDRVWFDRNSSGYSGGGLQVQQGSGSGPARITRSAFTRNYAVSNAGGLSLGQSTDVSVSNSLIADNVADSSGGGLDVFNTFEDKIELSWLTITGNYAGSQGGGMVLRGGETVGSLLVAGNSDGNASHAPDCLTLQEGPTSSGYNLIGAVGDEDCVFTGDTTGNQIGVAVNLSQVSMAGSDIPYAAPKTGSIAVGAVPATRCRRGSGRYEANDQLDLARPVNSTCTIGAIEGTSDLIFANGLDDSYAGE